MVQVNEDVAEGNDGIKGGKGGGGFHDGTVRDDF